MRWKSLRVATYNVGDGPIHDKLNDLARLLHRQPHAVLLCEVGDRGILLAVTARRHGYNLHRGSSDGQGKVAVLLRNDLPMLDSGYWPCSPRLFVGAWGAGPDVLDAKWIAWVRTKYAGRRLYIGATHAVPSVQRKSKSPGLAKRRGLYALHMARLRLWFTRRGVKIVGGDFNATSDFFMLRGLKCTGLTVATQPSHGRRAIDQLWTKVRLAVRLRSVVALLDYSSDHRPVLADYAIRLKGK